MNSCNQVKIEINFDLQITSVTTTSEKKKKISAVGTSVVLLTTSVCGSNKSEVG